jgi:hypothetical protein
MHAGAIHLAEDFIGNGTGLFVQKHMAFGQHREFSGAVVPKTNIRRAALRWG